MPPSMVLIESQRILPRLDRLCLIAGATAFLPPAQGRDEAGGKSAKTGRSTHSPLPNATVGSTAAAPSTTNTWQRRLSPPWCGSGRKGSCPSASESFHSWWVRYPEACFGVVGRQERFGPSVAVHLPNRLQARSHKYGQKSSGLAPRIFFSRWKWSPRLAASMNVLSAIGRGRAPKMENAWRALG